MQQLDKELDDDLFLSFFRAEEVKSHPFFEGIDWQQVYLQKYPPPLIPPRGEVNAADAFDIGSFDEEDTKGIKVTYVQVFLPRCTARSDVFFSMLTLIAFSV